MSSRFRILRHLRRERPSAWGRLVGYGYWGADLLRNYMELAEAWVKRVYDVRPRARGRRGAPTPASWACRHGYVSLAFPRGHATRSR